MHIDQAILDELSKHVNDPVRIARAERFEREKQEELRQRLINVAQASMRGDHGDAAVDVARYFFDGDISRADLARLQEFLKELQRLKIDVHSMPSRKSGGGRRRFQDE